MVPLRSSPTGPIRRTPGRKRKGAATFLSPVERRFPIAELLTDKLGDEGCAIGNRPSFSRFP